MLILHPRAVYLLDCGPIRRVGVMRPNLIRSCWTLILKLDDTVNCQPSQIRDYRLFAQTAVEVNSDGDFLYLLECVCVCVAILRILKPNLEKRNQCKR